MLAINNQKTTTGRRVSKDRIATANVVSRHRSSKQNSNKIKLSKDNNYEMHI